MPIISHITIPCGWIALWRVTESCAELAALCSAADMVAGEAYSREGRRSEWYAWRALLRSVEGDVDVKYDGVGAPVVVGRSDMHISVSHTEGYVAVMVSDRPCGLDIELASRDFSRVVGRCADPAEKALFGGSPYAGAVLWCAKEAAYKWFRREGVDLKRDIRVVSVVSDVGSAGPEAAVCGLSGQPLCGLSGGALADPLAGAPPLPPAAGTMTAEVKGRRVQMRYSAGGGIVVVWTE